MKKILENKVLKTIQKFNMLNSATHVIAGVSGGADSVAMLHILNKICTEKNFKIIATHVNHSLRGIQSDNDEIFVKKLCNKLNIPVYIQKIDVKKLSRKMKYGEEECGRKCRYDFFSKIAQKFGENCKIATAHHLNDNIETIFFNMARGTGLKGLCGIMPVRDSIIRPLIEVSRKEIEEYCAKNKLAYVTDDSNFCTKYTRNKIRQNIIPEFKKINPSFEKHMSILIENLINDDLFLNKIAENFFEKSKIILENKIEGFTAAAIKNLNNSVKNRVITRILAFFGVASIESKHLNLISELFGVSCGKITLPKNINLEFSNNILKKSQKFDFKTDFCNLKLLTKQKSNFIIKKMSTNECCKIKNADDKIFLNAMDYEKLPENYVFRTRQSKDFFSPQNRNVTKTIKKLFNELKIARENREKIVMLANGNEILWIDGIGVSEKIKITAETKTIFLILKENG